MLERFHSTLKHMMQKRGEASKEWDDFLPYVFFAYRDSDWLYPFPVALRQFQPGDQVLVFKPGEDKFEAQWQGPYTVESRINNLVYRIVTPERRKKLRQYHVNSMKEWKTPPAVMAVTYCKEETDEVLGDGPELYPFERGSKESLTLNTQLSTAQQVQVKALLEEFEDVFRNEPGNTQLATHSINTGDAKPVTISHAECHKLGKPRSGTRSTLCLKQK